MAASSGSRTKVDVLLHWWPAAYIWGGGGFPEGVRVPHRLISSSNVKHRVNGAYTLT